MILYRSNAIIYLFEYGYNGVQVTIWVNNITDQKIQNIDYYLFYGFENSANDMRPIRDVFDYEKYSAFIARSIVIRLTEIVNICIQRGFTLARTKKEHERFADMSAFVRTLIIYSGYIYNVVPCIIIPPQISICKMPANYYVFLNALQKRLPVIEQYVRSVVPHKECHREIIGRYINKLFNQYVCSFMYLENHLINYEDVAEVVLRMN